MQNNTPSLEEVKNHFDHWRATRRTRCKIPQSLWDKVKPIIGKYSVTSITQALGVNSGQLKQHIKVNDDIEFVNVTNSLLSALPSSISNANQPVVKSTVSIEISRANGNTLRVGELPASFLADIITRFIG